MEHIKHITSLMDKGLCGPLLSALALPLFLLSTGCAYMTPVDTTTTTWYRPDGTVEKVVVVEDQQVNDQIANIITGAGISTIVTIVLTHVLIL